MQETTLDIMGELTAKQRETVDRRLDAVQRFQTCLQAPPGQRVKAIKSLLAKLNRGGFKVPKATLYRLEGCYRERGLSGLVDGRGGLVQSSAPSTLPARPRGIPSRIITDLPPDRRTELNRQILAGQRADSDVFREFVQPIGLSRSQFARYAEKVRSESGYGLRPSLAGVLDQVAKMMPEDRVELMRRLFVQELATAVVSAVKRSVESILRGDDLADVVRRMSVAARK